MTFLPILFLDLLGLVTSDPLAAVIFFFFILSALSLAGTVDPVPFAFELFEVAAREDDLVPGSVALLCIASPVRAEDGATFFL